MKVRLTVCGDGGRLEDVEVDAPTGSTWREVLATLNAEGWSGRLAYLQGAAFPSRHDRMDRESALRPIPLDAIVGMPPLLSAAVVAMTSRRCPPRDRPPRPALLATEQRLHDETRLQVVGGPDAGGEYALRGEAAVVGRGIAADVRVQDGDMSRMHLRIDHQAVIGDQTGQNMSSADQGCDLRAAHGSAGPPAPPLAFRPPGGHLVLHDLGSTNGTFSDGHPVGAEGFALTAGAVVRAGDSTLAVVSEAPSSYVVAPDRNGRVVVHIPPRVLAARIDRQVSFPPEPEGRPIGPMSWISALVPAAVVLPLTVVAGGRMLGLALAAPLSAAALLAVDRSRARRSAVRVRNSYHELDVRAHAELRTALAEEARDRRCQAPDLATLLAAGRDVTAPLWERRTPDNDFGTVRLGTADLPARTSVSIGGSSGLPQDRSPPREIDRHGVRLAPELLVTCVPVTVSLPAVAMLGVVGPRPRALGLVRSAIVQLAILHRPSDLRIAVLAADHLAADWTWARWLPHIAHGSGALVGSSPPGRAAVTAVLREGDCHAGLPALRHTAHHSQLTPVRRVREPWEDSASGHGGTKVVPSTWRMTDVSRATVVVIDQDGDTRVGQDLADILRRTNPGSTWAVSLAATRAALPADCGAVVEFGTSGTRLTVLEDGGSPIRDVVADLVSHHRAAACARSLGRLRDQSHDQLIGLVDPGEATGRELRAPRGSRPPDVVHLLDLLGAEVLDESEAVRRWTEARPGAERVATVGAHASGPYRIDLGKHGPHMLVAGTTGAGKSEFLRTLVASIAASAPPQLVTFVLVDYKGGAAFADCVELPHVAGVLTDLDGASTARALTSLEAELRRRERLFREAEANDLDAYRLRRQAGDPGLPTVGSLLIVVDEFATLVDELPDFVTGLVSVARRGRSLGIHLVLATQRPAGVVTAEIRANLGLRVCLRVADAADSADVLGTTDAALIPVDRPGRALARTASGRPIEFQSALVSADVRRQAGYSRGPIAIRSLDWEACSAPPKVGGIDTASAGLSDLRELTGTLRAAGRLLGIETVQGPWLPPLTDVVTVDALSGEPRACSLPVALLDLPEEQRQSSLVIDLAAGEHWLAVGAPGSGKTTLLRTIAGQLATRLTAAEAHLYVLDSAAQALAPLTLLPHCGAVLGRSQPRAVDRLLTRLATEVQHRRRLLASRGAASAAETNAGAAPVPWMLLLVDDLSSLLEASDRVGGRPLSTLGGLLRYGPSAGLTVVLTGDHASLTTRITSLIQNRIVLRLADPADAALAGLRPRALGLSAGDRGASNHHVPAGRGALAPAGHALQIALLGSDPVGSAQNSALNQIAEAAAAGRSHTSPPAGLVRVVPLPDRVLHALSAAPPPGAESASPSKDRTPTSINAAAPATGARGTWLLLGAGGDLAEPTGIDLGKHGHLLFMGGPPGSGRTTSIRSISAWANRHGFTVLDIDSGADLIALTGTDRGPLLVVADDAERLFGRPAEEVLCRLLAQPPSWFSGAAIAGSADAFGASFSPLSAAVRRRSAVLLLGPPSRADLELVGRRIDRDDDPPPGRGVLVAGGREVDIQLAVCDPP